MNTDQRPLEREPERENRWIVLFFQIDNDATTYEIRVPYRQGPLSRYADVYTQLAFLMTDPPPGIIETILSALHCADEDSCLFCDQVVTGAELLCATCYQLRKANKLFYGINPDTHLPEPVAEHLWRRQEPRDYGQCVYRQDGVAATNPNENAVEFLVHFTGLNQSEDCNAPPLLYSTIMRRYGSPVEEWETMGSHETLGEALHDLAGLIAAWRALALRQDWKNHIVPDDESYAG